MRVISSPKAYQLAPLARKLLFIASLINSEPKINAQRDQEKNFGLAILRPKLSTTDFSSGNLARSVSIMQSIMLYSQEQTRHAKTDESKH